MELFSVLIIILYIIKTIESTIITNVPPSLKILIDIIKTKNASINPQIFGSSTDPDLYLIFDGNFAYCANTKNYQNKSFQWFINKRIQKNSENYWIPPSDERSKLTCNDFFNKCENWKITKENNGESVKEPYYTSPIYKTPMNHSVCFQVTHEPNKTGILSLLNTNNNSYVVKTQRYDIIKDKTFNQTFTLVQRLTYQVFVDDVNNLEEVRFSDAGFFTSRIKYNYKIASTISCELQNKQVFVINMCQDGYYGNNCNKKCIGNCLTGKCDKNSHCIANTNNEKCNAGYQQAYCALECHEGYFGKDCKEKCGNNCKEGKCDKIKGCQKCKENFLFPKCEECIDGFYGNDCSKSCGNCFMKNCNKSTGHCIPHNETGKICETDVYKDDLCNSLDILKLLKENLTIVIISIVVMIVAIVIGIFICCWIRKRCKSQNIVSINPINQENIYVTSVPLNEIRQQRNKRYPEVNYEEIILKHSYIITDLEQFVQQAIQNDFFTTQHTSLQRALLHSCNVGNSNDNAQKNRWKKMLPYDYTRVKLNVFDDNANDYINASYIHCYDRVYIAAQGPFANTVNDFWQMIYQENIQIIVMVTNLQENGQFKCEKYWPDVNACYNYGKFRIETLAEEIFVEHTERCIRLNVDNSQRDIYHFHYTAWPDHSVPRYPQSLAIFLKQIIDKIMNKSIPIVVHCSAGIGRTGTVILSLAGYFMYEKLHKTDMLGLLSQMREQRPYVVDNSHQYELAHKIILELNALKQSYFPVQTFYSEYKRVKDNNLFSIDFEKLLRMSKSDENIINLEMRWSNSDKNRFSSIIPSEDDYRVKLEAKDDYINAVYVTGLKMKNRYIVTQLPLPNTINDFWSMVLSNESDIILLLNSPESVGGKSSTVALWDENKEIKLNNLRIKYDSTIKSELWNIIKLQISGSSADHELKIYQYKELFYDSEVFQNPTNILKLWFEMGQGSNSTITVSCFDGAKLSGLFVAASLLFDRIANMKKIDINLAIRTVKRSRPQFVNSLEQYIFLYEAAIKYLEGTETYYAGCIKV